MDPTPQKILMIVNDGPYGNEHPYNALRLALNLAKRPGVQVRVFMTGDGVLCTQRGQKTPDGYYNIERMIKSLARRGQVAV
ncbi:MAG: DsrE/DsrF/TusD sulfur relay family protein [Anaerolineae bacterium]